MVHTPYECKSCFMATVNLILENKNFFYYAVVTFTFIAAKVFYSADEKTVTLLKSKKLMQATTVANEN